MKLAVSNICWKKKYEKTILNYLIKKKIYNLEIAPTLINKQLNYINYMTNKNLNFLSNNFNLISGILLPNSLSVANITLLDRNNSVNKYFLIKISLKSLKLGTLSSHNFNLVWFDYTQQCYEDRFKRKAGGYHRLFN